MNIRLYLKCLFYILGWLALIFSVGVFLGWLLLFHTIIFLILFLIAMVLSATTSLYRSEKDE